MVNFMENLNAVQTMVLNYAAMSLRPKIKDAILEHFFPPQTAVTMLKTVAAAMVQKTVQSYPNNLGSCLHPSGLRTYGAGGRRVHICERSEMGGTNTDKSLLLCAPKASRTAKTPLGLPKTQEPYFPKAKAKQTARSSATSATEASRRTSSDTWANSSVGARRLQSQ